MTAPGWLLPSLLASVFAALCATSVLQKSATFDESRYLGVGRYWLTHGSRDIADAKLHPPLASLIHGIPLLFVDVPEGIWGARSGGRRGQDLIALRADDWILNGARLAMLPVGVLLAWTIFAWSRALHGYWGGVLSLALASFCPNLIAHAALITPDVTLALFSVLSAWRVWRLADAPSRRNLVLAGVSLGLLLLSKHTALVLVPILAGTDLAYRLRTRTPDAAAQRAREAARTWAALLAIAAATLWAGYLFQVGPVRLPSGSELLLPAPDYFKGALFQWQQSRLPHDAFLMGERSPTGWWYFYLVLFALKVPIATSLLLAGLVLGSRRLGLRREPAEIYLWLPALLLLLYLSFFNTIHSGFRYLLPVHPLLLIWIGKYARCPAPPRWLRPALAGALVWVAAASVWIWPDPLAYHNEWIGGPRHGYEWTSDSNLDWGQDLKQLKHYLDRKGIRRVRLAYFGTADPRHYGIAYEWLPGNRLLRRTPPLADGESPAPVVAVSAHAYQRLDPAEDPIYAELAGLAPNDLVGYSILIFDLRHPIPKPD